MNNSCSTDFIDECLKDDFPYRVVCPQFIFKPSVTTGMGEFYPMVKKYTSIELKEQTRFDLLDIREEKKSKYSSLTVEKIAKQINKMKEEIMSDSPTWKEEKPHIPLSEDNLIKMMEEEVKIAMEKSFIEYIEKTQITNRFEILDL